MVSGLFKLLHLWCTLFLLLLLYQLHSRSSDIRPQRLQILALSFCKLFVEEKKGGWEPHFPSFSSHKYKHLGFFSIHIGLYASSPIYSTEESGIYTGGWLTEASQGMIPPHPERWLSVAGWPQSAGSQPARRYASSLQLLMMVRMWNILIWNIDYPYERHARSLLQWSSKERDSAATGNTSGFLGNHATDTGLRLVRRYQLWQLWSLNIVRCLPCSFPPKFHQMWGTFIRPVFHRELVCVRLVLADVNHFAALRGCPEEC